jgi:hypothetical protein
LNIKFCPSVNLRELLSYTLKRSETLNPGGAKRSATTALITGSAGRQNTVDTPNIPYTPWIVRRNIDWEAIGARRYELGLVGEHIVLHEETRSLTSDNRPDLAALVKNVDREGCLHPGYDIVSFTKAGQEKFIEVKATSGALGNPFEMSANELAFLESHPDSAYVYRVTIPDNSDQAQIAILNASVVLAGRREVTEYRVDPKSSE